jgi:ADP-heptose:LPS heptosyltransferase
MERPPVTLLHQGEIIAELQARHFDLAYVLVSDTVSLMLPWRAGIPRSIGYDFNGRGFALSEPHQPHPAANFPAWHSPPPSPVPHVTRLWADLVQKDAVISPPVIALDDAIRTRGEKVWSFAPKDTVRLIIHPGASSANYTWSPDHWRALGEILGKRLNNVAVLVTGSTAERSLAEETARSWSFPHRIVAGELDFPTLAAAVASAHATAGPDTSIGHIAAAVGTPVAVLFGPGDHRMWRPAGPAIVVRNNSGCWGCKRPECFQPFTMCTALTTVETMADAVEACLAGRAKPPEAL